jgi:hypothetical protein
MEWMLPLVLGALALFYICQPLLSGASQTKRQTNFEGWHSLEQLEIDRQLGKIDDAEFEELQKRVPEPTSVALPGEQNLLERLIFGARRQKRLQVSLESEVLIARARKRGQN